MFSLPKPIKVCWCSDELYQTSPQVRILDQTAQASGCDVQVRDISHKKVVRKKVYSPQHTAPPTLLIVDNTHVEVATVRLREIDDVCLAGSPWDLIKYRICRLYTNAARKRDQQTASHRRRELICELKQHATTDALTQVYNRRYLDHQLEVDVLAANCGDGTLSVGLIDIDNFGLVNKVHGWPTGDLVLKQVCSIMQSNLRSTDWVSRYGGEEFLVVLRNANLQQARTILERLRSAVQQATFESTSGQPLKVTMSIGVVQHDAHFGSRQQLLESVSRQTLAAKHAGRNCLRP